MEDADNDGSRTPKASEAKLEKRKGSTSIDPALRSEEEKPSESASTPPATSEVEDKRDEEWVENIRLIEALRKWVGERLKSGDFDDAQDQDSKSGAEQSASAQDVDMKNVAQLVAERLSAENAKDDAAAKESSREKETTSVSYPTLPAAA